jgi:hypothetical protein
LAHYYPENRDIRFLRSFCKHIPEHSRSQPKHVLFFFLFLFMCLILWMNSWIISLIYVACGWLAKSDQIVMRTLYQVLVTSVYLNLHISDGR